MYRTIIPGAIIVIILLLLAVALGAWHFVSIKSTGTPLGPALRLPGHIAQIISTTERYLPTLHRNPGKDRFRLDLLVISIDDPTKQETFTLLRQQQSNALQPMTKILGADSDVVWVNALEIFAVNLKTKRIARETDLRKANPELELFLSSAKPEFADHFIAVSPDWSQAFSFSPETFKASACASPSRGSWLEAQSANHVEGSLCSGGMISTNTWISVATPDEAKSDFKAGFSLPRDFTAREKDRARQLYRGTANISEQRPRIENCERVSETEYRAANFLRAKPGGPLLLAGSPEGAFLIHRVGAQLFAPFHLTRLAPDGKPQWNADTDIGRLEQILPDEKIIAIIGTRPVVPDKVPEPILVLINTSNGAMTTLSLWR